MTDLKNRTLYLNSGRQIKLYGDSVAINPSLEIGEGYAPNIFALTHGQPDNNISVGMTNPHGLTAEDLMELADFNIQLWMDLKAGLRRHGGTDPKVFRLENAKLKARDQEQSNRGRKRKNAVKEGQ